MQTQTFRGLRAGAAAVLACMSSAALAERPGDRFWGELAYFYPTISSTARLDLTATSRPGTTIRLEDELDLDDRTGTPYVLLGMRLGERWRLEFEYYELARSASTAISRQIEWGDVTFPAGVQIDTKFDTTVYRLSGGYSFYQQPAAEAGVAFGLHVTDFSVALAGQGIGPGGGTATFQNEARNTLVPLPTLGLYGTYKLSEQWQLRGRVDYLSLQYGDYDGSLVNVMASFDWRFHKNWGAGVGYRYVDYTLDAESSDLRGEVNYKFHGPTLFVNAAF